MCIWSKENLQVEMVEIKLLIGVGALSEESKICGEPVSDRYYFDLG